LKPSFAWLNPTLKREAGGSGPSQSGSFLLNQYPEQKDPCSLTSYLLVICALSTLRPLGVGPLLAPPMALSHTHTLGEALQCTKVPVLLRTSYRTSKPPHRRPQTSLTSFYSHRCSRQRPFATTHSVDGCPTTATLYILPAYALRSSLSSIVDPAFKPGQGSHVQAVTEYRYHRPSMNSNSIISAI
jgi:hypothetical protein